MASLLNDSVSKSAFFPNVGMPGLDTLTRKSADELCDDLLLHTFECDSCINGEEESCPTFCGLREQIVLAGGPTKGVFLSM